MPKILNDALTTPPLVSGQREELVGRGDPSFVSWWSWPLLNELSSSDLGHPLKEGYGSG